MSGFWLLRNGMWLCCFADILALLHSCLNWVCRSCVKFSTPLGISEPLLWLDSKMLRFELVLSDKQVSQFGRPHIALVLAGHDTLRLNLLLDVRTHVKVKI